MRYKIGQSASFIILISYLFYTTSCISSEEKKVFYINSNHEGYPSSDDIRDGIVETLQGEAIDLEIFYLDTKLHPEKEEVKARIEEALIKIERFAPDLIIASDDNVVGKLVVP